MTVAASLGNLAGIEESATLGMTARAAALSREGRSVVSLSAGEPDFATPEYIREAGVRAIREGHTHYPPAAGLRALREAIAAHVAEVDGAPCSPAEVLVSAGAKQAFSKRSSRSSAPATACSCPRRSGSRIRRWRGSRGPSRSSWRRAPRMAGS